jgi:hypothetical protein
VVRENLQLAQSRQKSYADHRRRKLSFKVGDFVYLKVSPMRGLRHFKIRVKLAPRYIGPFKILYQRGEVAYQLELPPQLSDVHDVFHISQLRKCLRVPEEQMPLNELTISEDLTYQEYPIKFLDTSEKVTRNNRYKMCKVQWSNCTKDEATSYLHVALTSKPEATNKVLAEEKTSQQVANQALQAAHESNFALTRALQDVRASIDTLKEELEAT